MTTIGLVSDTHFPRFGRALPRALEDGLRAAKVSRILHMGDFTDALAIGLFEAIAPLDAVAGNNDPEEIWKRYGRQKIVTVDGVRIGLVRETWAGGNAHDNAIRRIRGETGRRDPLRPQPPSGGRKARRPARCQSRFAD